MRSPGRRCATGSARSPAEERSALHARAAQWLSANGLVAAAAQHALAAGRRDWACELAERSLYDSLMARGRLDDVQEWFSIIPSAESDARPRLLLAAAWSFAIGERHEEAERLVARVLARDDIDDELRCECALIRAGAAVFADDPDRFAALHDPWAVDPPLTDPWLLKIHANRSAFRALLDGEPAMARLRQQRAPRGDPDAAPGHLGRWSDFIIGLSYLWEGQVLLAERILRPALLQADADLGRRNPFSCMLAALLAAALWERDQPRDAELALANRLDVLERSGMPEAVLLAFRTLARIAAERSEARALDLLEGLDAVGVQRGLPRLRVVSLAEQVMLHSRRYRAETCRGLMARIDALHRRRRARRAERSGGEAAEMYRDLARGYAAIAARDWRAARAPFERANAAARAAKRHQLYIETLGFRALVLHHCGEDAAGLAQEAVELAKVYGLPRVFDDAHPALGERIVRILSRAPAGDAPSAEPRRAPPPAARRDAEAELIARSTALTPEGAGGARAARAQPVEQGNRPDDEHPRGYRQMAREEPFRQAQRREPASRSCRGRGSWASWPRPPESPPPSPGSPGARRHPPLQVGGRPALLRDTTLQEAGRQGGHAEGTGATGGQTHDRSD